jgi:dTDP-4-dehydrorhamnose 3,5-epimerase
VDVRPTSKTYGKWFGIELSGQNKRQLFIPAGFAHGFLTRSNIAVVCYKASDYYHPEDERCILWNDKDLGIIWPGLKKAENNCERELLTLSDGTPLILSEKDSRGESWRSFIYSTL